MKNSVISKYLDRNGKYNPFLSEMVRQNYKATNPQKVIDIQKPINSSKFTNKLVETIFKNN